MNLFPINPSDPGVTRQITELWNEACGKALEISDRLVEYNAKASPAACVNGCLALVDGQPAGFVLTSAIAKSTPGLSRTTGWVEAICVHPAVQGHGIGSKLLTFAEAQLFEQGCSIARLGGGLYPFAPGLPVFLNQETYFLNRGYEPRAEESHVWDVSRDLEDYSTPAQNPQVEVRPLQEDGIEKLDAFLRREFPGRWRFEFQEHLRRGGRPSDYLILWKRSVIMGYCQITLSDSARPLDRFYPHGLLLPWGQLGPIGISAEARGQGLGTIILSAGLGYLHDQGVRGCVIDWVSAPAFYRKFGFQPHNEYLVLMKALV